MGGGGGGGGGARVSVFFYTQNLNLKKKNIFFCFLGVGGGVDGWTDEQAQTNLPLQLLQSWGHNSEFMINVQVMSLTSSIYDHFII